VGNAQIVRTLQGASSGVFFKKVDPRCAQGRPPQLQFSEAPLCMLRRGKIAVEASAYFFTTQSFSLLGLR
jgi:hypothetical protein